jgi:hypothetical protein
VEAAAACVGPMRICVRVLLGGQSCPRPLPAPLCRPALGCRYGWPPVSRPACCRPARMPLRTPPTSLVPPGCPPPPISAHSCPPPTTHPSTDCQHRIPVLPPPFAPPAQLVLVGHDWGANVCWGAAATSPHLFCRLAILCVPHPARFLANMDWDQFRRSWWGAGKTCSRGKLCCSQQQAKVVWQPAAGSGPAAGCAAGARYGRAWAGTPCPKHTHVHTRGHVCTQRVPSHPVHPSTRGPAGTSLPSRCRLYRSGTAAWPTAACWSWR